MLGTDCLTPNDSDFHPLLDPPPPSYTETTVRRASIVWLHCGKRNKFEQVCKYFHHLECLEEKLSADARKKSRYLEFNLITKYPPTSHFLCQHFPKLYRHNKVGIKESQRVTLENCVFNFQGFHDMRVNKRTTTKFILETSQLIKLYSKTHSKTLKTLLTDFEDFLKKTKAKNTVDHFAMYIKQLFLKDELVTWSDMPRTFSFLELGDTDTLNDSGIATKVLQDNKGPNLVIDQTMNADASKIKILMNESRRKELFNMIPNYKDVAKFTDEKEKPGSVFHDLVHKME